jgi:hypothetical protein
VAEQLELSFPPADLDPPWREATGERRAPILRPPGHRGHKCYTVEWSRHCKRQVVLTGTLDPTVAETRRVDLVVGMLRGLTIPSITAGWRQEDNGILVEIADYCVEWTRRRYQGQLRVGHLLRAAQTYFRPRPDGTGYRELTAALRRAARCALRCQLQWPCGKRAPEKLLEAVPVAWLDNKVTSYRVMGKYRLDEVRIRTLRVILNKPFRLVLKRKLPPQFVAAFSAKPRKQPKRHGGRSCRGHQFLFPGARDWQTLVSLIEGWLHEVPRTRSAQIALAELFGERRGSGMTFTRGQYRVACDRLYAQFRSKTWDRPEAWKKPSITLRDIGRACRLGMLNHNYLAMAAGEPGAPKASYLVQRYATAKPGPEVLAFYFNARGRL